MQPWGYKHQSFIDKTKFKNISAKNLDSIKTREKTIKQTSKGPVPPRIGYHNHVKFDMFQQGVLKKTKQGDSIYTLSFHVEKAKAVNLLFDKFWLPKGSRLYIYNKQKTHVLGPYTNANNNGSRRQVKGFSSGIVAGRDIILEYHPSNNASQQTLISLKSIVNIYKPPRFLAKNIAQALGIEKSEAGFGDSGPCQVNVNCSPEGDNWQDEKKSVALMLVDGTRVCSGFLINNSSSNDSPYFQTADHCIYNKDAINDPDFSNSNYYFDYESDGCSDPSSEPSYTELGAGATVLANKSYTNGSDFALLKLNRDPKEVLDNNKIYYAGWDRTNNQPSGGKGIHHPLGDIKKIATHDIEPQNSNYCYNNDQYWEIWWKSTQNGFSVTEGVSSGSPLFNSDSKVIGQLWGSCDGENPNCGDPSNDEAQYGKIYSSWNNSQKERRLIDWVAPLGLNPTALDGRYAGSSSANPCKHDPDNGLIENKTITTDLTYPAPCNSYTFKNVTIENNSNVAVKAETTIDKDFEVKNGSSFEITP